MRFYQIIGIGLLVQASLLGAVWGEDMPPYVDAVVVEKQQDAITPDLLNLQDVVVERQQDAITPNLLNLQDVVIEKQQDAVTPNLLNLHDVVIEKQQDAVTPNLLNIQDVVVERQQDATTPNLLLLFNVVIEGEGMLPNASIVVFDTSPMSPLLRLEKPGTYNVMLTGNRALQAGGTLYLQAGNETIPITLTAQDSNNVVWLGTVTVSEYSGDTPNGRFVWSGADFAGRASTIIAAGEYIDIDVSGVVFDPEFYQGWYKSNTGNTDTHVYLRNVDNETHTFSCAMAISPRNSDTLAPWVIGSFIGPGGDEPLTLAPGETAVLTLGLNLVMPVHDSYICALSCNMTTGGFADTGLLMLHIMPMVINLEISQLKDDLVGDPDIEIWLITNTGSDSVEVIVEPSSISPAADAVDLVWQKFLLAAGATDTIVIVRDYRYDTAAVGGLFSVHVDQQPGFAETVPFDFHAPLPSPIPPYLVTLMYPNRQYKIRDWYCSNRQYVVTPPFGQPGFRFTDGGNDNSNIAGAWMWATFAKSSARIMPPHDLTLSLNRDENVIVHWEDTRPYGDHLLRINPAYVDCTNSGNRVILDATMPPGHAANVSGFYIAAAYRQLRMNSYASSLLEATLRAWDRVAANGLHKTHDVPPVITVSAAPSRVRNGSVQLTINTDEAIFPDGFADTYNAPYEIEGYALYRGGNRDGESVPLTIMRENTTRYRSTLGITGQDTNAEVAIFVRGRDLSTNLSAYPSYAAAPKVIIDFTAPVFTLDPHIIGGGERQITVYANEELSAAPTISMVLPDGATDEPEPVAVGPLAWQFTVTVPPAVDGLMTVSIAGSDIAGNAATQAEKVEIDALSPTLVITQPFAGAVVAGEVPIIGTATDVNYLGLADNFAGYSVAIGYGMAPSAYETVIAGAVPVVNGLLGAWASGNGVDGPATLKFTCTDKAGNSVELLRAVVLNNHLPTFTLDIAPTVIDSGEVTVTVQASEALSAMPAATVALPGQGMQWLALTQVGENRYQGTISIDPACSEGAAIITVTGTDLGGSTGSETGTVYIDRSAPQPIIISPAANAQVLATFVADLAIADVSPVTYTLEIGEGDAPAAYVAIAAGAGCNIAQQVMHTCPAPVADTYTLRLTATDAGGRTAAVTATFGVLQSITVYSQDGLVSLTYPITALPLGTLATITAEAVPGPSVVQAMDSGDYTPVSGLYDLAPHGTVFNPPCPGVLVFNYTELGGTDERHYQLYTYDTATMSMVAVARQFTNLSGHTIVGQLDHCSLYALLYHQPIAAAIQVAAAQPVCGEGEYALTLTSSEPVTTATLTLTSQGGNPLAIMLANPSGDKITWLGAVRLDRTLGDGIARFAWHGVTAAGVDGTIISAGEELQLDMGRIVFVAPRYRFRTAGTQVEQFPVVVRNNDNEAHGLLASIQTAYAGLTLVFVGPGGDTTVVLAPGASHTLTLQVDARGLAEGVYAANGRALSFSDPLTDLANFDIVVAPLPLPDLAITGSAVTMQPSHLDANDTVSITAIVANSGDTVATNVAVTMTDVIAGAPIFATVIPLLQPGETAAVTAITQFTLSGIHYLLVNVDPANTIAEADEENNRAGKIIGVGATNQSARIVVRELAVMVGLQTATVTGAAYYEITDLLTGAVDATLPVRGADVRYTLVADALVAGDVTRAAGNLWWQFGLTRLGWQTLRVHVTDHTFSTDPEAEVAFYVDTIVVVTGTSAPAGTGSSGPGGSSGPSSPAASGLDLSIYSGDIQFRVAGDDITRLLVPPYPSPDEPVLLAVTVHNNSPAANPRADLLLKESYFIPGYGTVTGVLNRIPLTLTAGSATVFQPWVPNASGVYIIEGDIIPTPADIFSHNNQATRGITIIDGADQVSIVITQPLTGDTVLASETLPLAFTLRYHDEPVQPEAVRTLLLEIGFGLEMVAIPLDPATGSNGNYQCDWAIPDYWHSGPPMSIRVSTQLNSGATGEAGCTVAVVDDVPLLLQASLSPQSVFPGDSVVIVVSASEPLLNGWPDTPVYRDSNGNNIPIIAGVWLGGYAYRYTTAPLAANVVSGLLPCMVTAQEALTLNSASATAANWFYGDTFALRLFTPDPAGFNPTYNDLGANQHILLSFSVNRPGSAVVTISDNQGIVRTTAMVTVPGLNSLVWDGRDQAGNVIAGNHREKFTVQITATAQTGEQAEAETKVSLLRKVAVLANVTATPPALDRHLADPLVTVAYTLFAEASNSKPNADVRLRITDAANGTVVYELVHAVLRSPTGIADQFVWDGCDLNGIPVAAGCYQYSVHLAANVQGNDEFGVIQVIDATSESITSGLVTIHYTPLSPAVPLVISEIAVPAAANILAVVDQGFGILQSPIYEFAPAGTPFVQPALLAFAYGSIAGYPADALALVRFNPATAAWEAVPGSYNDKATSTLYAPLDHFSRYTVVAMVMTDNLPPQITVATALPSLIAPDLDGGAQQMTISCRVSDGNAPYLPDVHITVADTAGVPVAMALDHTRQAAGDLRVPYAGTDAAGAMLQEGNYQLVIGAADVAGNAAQSVSLPVAIDRNAPQTVCAVVAGPQQNGFVTAATRFALSATDAVAGVATTFYALDGQNFQPYQEPFGLSGEGSHTIAYYSVDAVGHGENVRTDMYRLDSIPPAIAVTVAPAVISPDGNGVDDQAIISLSVADNWPDYPGTLRVTVADALGTTVRELANVEPAAYGSRSLPWEGCDAAGIQVAAGLYRIVIEAADAAGNQTTANAEITVQYDATPPMIILQQPATPTNQDVTLVYIATDNVTPANQLVITGDNSPYSSEGSHSVALTATDAAGNSATSNTVTFVIDKTAPAAAMHVGTPQYGEYVTPATPLTLTATDNLTTVTGISYRIDGGAWVDYVGAFTLAGAGAHTVEYFATDAATNQSAAQSRTLTVDDATPATGLAIDLISLDGAVAVSESKITLTATDAGCGVEKIEYRVNGGAWITYSAPFELQEVTGLGMVTIGYRVTDRLGNCETEQSATYTVKKALALSANLMTAPRVLCWWNEKLEGGIPSRSEWTAALTAVFDSAALDYAVVESATAFKAKLADYNVYLIIGDSGSLDAAGESEVAAQVAAGKTLVSFGYEDIPTPQTDDQGWENIFGIKIAGVMNGTAILSLPANELTPAAQMVEVGGKTELIREVNGGIVLGEVALIEHGQSRGQGQGRDDSDTYAAIVAGFWGAGKVLYLAPEYGRNLTALAGLLTNAVGWAQPATEIVIPGGVVGISVQANNAVLPITLRVYIEAELPSGTDAVAVYDGGAEQGNAVVWTGDLAVGMTGDYRFLLRLPTQPGPYLIKVYGYYSKELGYRLADTCELVLP